MSDYEMYMRRALELARQAEGCTSPNPMVGCVIADEDGNIVGEGWHRKAGTPHAEVNAIADMNAKQRQGHTAFVTLEPCSHWGRTGPCCEALIKAGIKRVVAAMEDPNPKVAGNGFRRLREAGVEVITGVCEKEARRLNEHFLLWVTQNRPFVSLKFAETLDGKLATTARDSHFVTGQEAHTYSHYLRKIHDAILVGIGTVLDDDPELTTRLVEGKNPIRIVLDSRARIPLTAKVLQGDAKTLIITGPEADADACDTLRRLHNVEVVTLPCENGFPFLLCCSPYMSMRLRLFWWKAAAKCWARFWTVGRLTGSTPLLRRNWWGEHMRCLPLEAGALNGCPNVQRLWNRNC